MTSASTRTVSDVDAAIAALDEQTEAIRVEAAQLLRAAESQATWTAGQRKADREYKTSTEKLLDQRAALISERGAIEAAELAARHAQIRALFDAGGSAVEPIGQAPPSPSTPNRGSRMSSMFAPPLGLAEGAALRAIGAHVNSPEAQDRLDRIVRDRDGDPLGLGARYLAAVSEPAYTTAFAKAIRYGPSAALAFTREEQAAMAATMGIVQERAALGVGTGSTGGYAVPFSLDPSVILTSAGSVNPLRDICRVETIATDVWKGLSSDGVSVAYGEEGTVVDDTSPTFGQPTAQTERATGWVPFSIELSLDWPRLQRELATILIDAKDQLEATQFLYGSGHGSFQPEGLITTLAPGSVVSTDDSSWPTSAVYGMLEALPPRAQANARWLAPLKSLNHIRFLVGPGSLESQLLAPDGLLRRPVHEHSGFATGDELLVGDFSRFVIVDRIGMQLEVVQHVFDPSTGRPTGRRGLFAYWRNSSTILDDGAFRLLQVTPGS